MKNVDEVIEAIKAEFEVATDKELADVLHVDPSTIAAWRRRGSVPEKYQLRSKNASDNSAIRIFVATKDLSRLKQVYVFSLVGHLAVELNEKLGIFSTPLQVDMIIGGYLRKAHAYYSKQLKDIRQDETAELRTLYEQLLAKQKELDLYEWVETLPDPHF